LPYIWRRIIGGGAGDALNGAMMVYQHTVVNFYRNSEVPEKNYFLN
jgi:hypothetical protein